MGPLDTPLERLIGAKTARTLAAGLDLHTAGDLLRHYPRRYASRGELTDIGSLAVGEYVTVVADVLSASKRRMKTRSGTLVEVMIGDGRHVLKCTFFNQAWREKQLHPGVRGLFAGKVTRFNRKLQLAHPECLVLSGDGDDDAVVDDFARALIPVYPSAQKIQSWVIANSVRIVLDTLTGPAAPEDPLPEPVRRSHGLVGHQEALRGIHRPETTADVETARRRLKWDEALAVQLALAQRRLALADRPAPACPPVAGGLLDGFDAQLPFTLTGGQRAIGEQITRDLAAEHPMNRLVQGEVGSGKTVIALRAMLQVVDAGRQAALLAPTEVLAAQHARSLRELLGPLGRAGELDGAEQATSVTLLTGSLGARSRKKALLDAVSGSAGIVVGTHALIQERVGFADLGLVVVDEQHRFGVEQRDALRGRAGTQRCPHVLVMTATPIPRTVAMTVYGDLEVSSLRELPVGRAPISTTVVPAGEKPAWLDRAWRRITEEVAAGHQAYVVCPRIGDAAALDEDVDFPPAVELVGSEPPDGDDAGEAVDADSAGARRPPLAVSEVAPMLIDGPLAGLRVGVLHGRLPAEEKDLVMRSFADGTLDVLVATTVIEVGVDVPNATVMVIMDADRFGVSQLHQLRGRVGRGSAPGLCLLVTDAVTGSPARERLDAVAATSDGFELARLDLELRREGDILGAAQHGRRSGLRLLSLLRDEQLIADARAVAAALITEDAALRRYPALAASVADLVAEDRAEYLEKT
ncbi:MAG TPA: ATP-dependent DNA helicase RecG [Pseudonocardiaceae bacterium]|jgi:ATP-dependent DNA helicase RecG